MLATETAAPQLPTDCSVTMFVDCLPHERVRRTAVRVAGVPNRPRFRVAHVERFADVHLTVPLGVEKLALERFILDFHFAPPSRVTGVLASKSGDALRTHSGIC